MTSITKQEAAARLGMAESEIVDVADSKVGPVIRTIDGVAYVDVAADTPDREGRTGLMFLTRPNPKYNGVFPVFSGAVAQEDTLLKALGIDLDEAPPRPGDGEEASAEALITEPGPRRGAEPKAPRAAKRA